MRSASALALVLVSGLAFAESPEKGFQYSESVSTLDKAAGQQLTQEERTLAKQWMLTDSDWVKYKNIMKGPRGIWSPGLDPITALGVEETDERERDRYAEIWMRVEGRRKELEIKFEHSRNKAAKVVFGNMKAIQNDAWIAEWNRENIAPKKAVALFMDSSCTAECKGQFDDIYNSLNAQTRLDIYFEEGVSGTEISTWASTMGVDPEIVKSRRVTLNFDEGTAARMGVYGSQRPQVRETEVK
tara:strand:+ start:6162 stop:6890 length:729 start_codon:yes stop_codon:yes gene_type:complete